MTYSEEILGDYTTYNRDDGEKYFTIHEDSKKKILFLNKTCYCDDTQDAKASAESFIPFHLVLYSN